MSASLLLAAAMWPALVTQTCPTLDDAIMVGIARARSGDFLYCESITMPRAHELHVDYVRDGKVFATKDLSYNSNSLMPNVLQRDARTGELREAKIVESNLLMRYQPNSHKKLAEITVVTAKVDTVDAGFDNFVREHWNELQTGKALSVNFASIAHQKVLPLRINVQPIEKCSTVKSVTAPKAVCFFVEIDNAFLRLLLGNIKLVYDQQHRLQQFDGVVNIADEKEDTQNATIFYYYREDYLTQ